MTPNLDEPRRLLELGFKLCKLEPHLKKPVGNGWNLNPVRTIDSKATGYGMMLASNNLCSVDPDNLEPAREGMARCGFDLERLMTAGVRTVSTRPNSGGRSTFKAPAGVKWITFASKSRGTILELRAESPNLQDAIPGVVYADKAGELYTQRYANERTFDDAPELPAEILAWWQRLSTDLEFKRQQQALLAGADALLAVSGDSGGKLAFASTHRMWFNSTHAVQDILELNNYTQDPRSERYAPHTANGAPSVRPIPEHPGLWHSDHASDPLFGTFDAWTANVVLNFNGDLELTNACAEEEHAAELRAEFDNLGPLPPGTDTRELQRQRAQALRDRAPNGLPLKLDLSQMTAELVFISEGSQVCFLSSPKNVLMLQDARNHFSHCRTTREATGGEKPKTIQTLDLWIGSPNRLTAQKRTFAPGKDPLTHDPAGVLSFNTWRARVRGDVDPAVKKWAVDLFVGHVRYLFGGDADNFLDFLAHLEQRPGELPHSGWLHVSKKTGTGRNWLTTVLDKVWRGECSVNLELEPLLKSQFNGVLSGVLLAVVDEARVSGEVYATAERLKQMINPEFRHVNPKFGKQSTEFNCCRWLILSNHEDAVPLDSNDRRFWVVMCDAEPRPADDYIGLYGALKKPGFFDAIGGWLAERDIAAFNPGARPTMNEAKLRIVAAGKSELRIAADELVNHHHADVITQKDLTRYLAHAVGQLPGGLTPGMRHALIDAGAVQVRDGRGDPKRVKIMGLAEKIWVLREHSQWAGALPHQLADEAEKQPTTGVINTNLPDLF